MVHREPGRIRSLLRRIALVEPEPWPTSEQRDLFRAAGGIGRGDGSWPRRDYRLSSYMALGADESERRIIANFIDGEYPDLSIRWA
jgi:hypothetical protein